MTEREDPISRAIVRELDRQSKAGISPPDPVALARVVRDALAANPQPPLPASRTPDQLSANNDG